MKPHLHDSAERRRSAWITRKTKITPLHLTALPHPRSSTSPPAAVQPLLLLSLSHSLTQPRIHLEHVSQMVLLRQESSARELKRPKRHLMQIMDAIIMSKWEARESGADAGCSLSSGAALSSPPTTSQLAPAPADADVNDDSRSSSSRWTSLDQTIILTRSLSRFFWCGLRDPFP